MQTFSDQTALAAYARERLTSQLERAQSLVAGADEATFTRPRPDGGWSPASILDHLSVMNRLYLPRIERAIATAVPSSRRDWRPTLTGRMLRRGVTTSMKIKTLSIFKPEDPKSDSHSLDRFLSSQGDLLRTLDSSKELHWRSVRLSSPASELVKLNLGDIFVVLADHGDRHLAQIESHLFAIRKGYRPL